MNSRQWYICDSMRFGSFLPWQCSVAPAVGLLMLSGCSIVLNLDDRRCETHSQCSADGSSMCVLGICEEVETTTNDTTSSGTTTSDTTDSMSSTSSSNPGDDTLADDESSTSGEETTGDDSTSTSSSTSGTTGDETGSTGCSGDECDPGGEESTSMGEEGESSESTGEEPPPLPVELITNNDFEATHVPWSFQAGTADSGQPASTFTRTTEVAHTGIASGYMRNRYQHWAGARVTVTSRVQVDVPYAVSMWVRLADETFTSSMLELSYKIHCAEFDQADYLPIFAADVTNDDWTELAGEFMVPYGCTLIELALYVQSPVSMAAPYPDYYIDDAYATPILP